jgi:predicted chitinase
MAKESTFKKINEKIIADNTVIRLSAKNKSPKTAEESQQQIVTSLDSISESVRSLTNNFSKLNAILLSLINETRRQQYIKREQELENIRAVIRPDVSLRYREKENTESFSRILKDLFTNAAVIGALSGIAFLILPKEYKDKVLDFFKGFTEGIKEALGNIKLFDISLKELDSSLKALGYGLAAILGIGAAAKILEAINLMVALVKAGRKRLKGLAGKGAGLLTFKNLSPAIIAGTVIFGIGGTVADFIRDILKDSEEEEKKQPPSVRPSPTFTGPVQLAPEAELNKQMLVEEIKQRGITDETSIKNILAQVQAESGFVPRSEEIEKYTAKNIYDMFGPEQKKNKVRVSSLKEAEELVSKGPEAVAEVLYGGRMGNIQPGDAYKYRGRGFIQLTGREAYQRVGEAIGVDLVNNPDLANDPEIAAKIVPAFLLDYKKKSVEELSDIGAVTRAVGSADIRAAERRARIAQSMTIEPVTPPTAAVQAPEPLSYTPLPSPSVERGATIIAASEKAEAVQYDIPVINSSVNNRLTELGADRSMNPPPDIPNPMADRGSLLIGTTHSTAYS